ncbi:hypothetical protein [Streptomyces sp. NPDC056544]|uniref:hypothetical protein n=1 Tax=unclassified Streptomyces TaxID=2593676 RepID=UPI003695B5F2
MNPGRYRTGLVGMLTVLAARQKTAGRHRHARASRREARRHRWPFGGSAGGPGSGRDEPVPVGAPVAHPEREDGIGADEPRQDAETMDRKALRSARTPAAGRRQG